MKFFYSGADENRLATPIRCVVFQPAFCCCCSVHLICTCFALTGGFRETKNNTTDVIHKRTITNYKRERDTHTRYRHAQTPFLSLSLSFSAVSCVIGFSFFPQKWNRTHSEAIARLLYSDVFRWGKIRRKLFFFYARYIYRNGVGRQIW